MPKDDFVTMHQAEMGIWASKAKPGEEYVYLKAAKTAAAGKGRKPEAQAAWNLYMGGLVHLVQRKLGAGRYDYIAVRTKAPA